FVQLVPRKESSDDAYDRSIGIPKNEDDMTYFSSSNAVKTSRFVLLMKNLDTLENMFSDSYAVRLEDDILEQLQRLGAIHLFNSCLSTTLRSAETFDSSSHAPADVLRKIDSANCKVIVQSGKKELRKLRRKRAVDFEAGNLSLQFTSRDVRKNFRTPKTDSARAVARSRYKKQRITQSESDMAAGFKLVTELERIRKKVEDESGETPSFSRWAEAARIESKELKRRLNYGWHCRDQLLKSSRSLVVFIARNYWGLGIAFEDLIQAGNMAVLRGAERFDQSRGYKFSTYVQYWIRKSMSMLVANHSRGIRIPGTMNKVINQVQNARKQLCAATGRTPSDLEVAKLTGISLERIRSAGRCPRVVGSVDRRVGNPPGTLLMEVTADESICSPEEAAVREERARDVERMVRGLEWREREVLVLRFGLGRRDGEKKSLQEIGKILCVSKEWVRRIETTALAKLRRTQS
ncbi:hypothetical protein M569_09119, partial [Genlisea aurea]